MVSGAQLKVRGGGIHTPDGFLFELTGGALCLDFVNTLDERPAPQPRELLGSYADLLAWGEQAGAIDDAAARRLTAHAARQSSAAQAALRRAKRARETLFETFRAVAGRRPAPADAIAALNEELPSALSRLELRPEGFGFALSFPRGEPALDQVRWSVLRSAADLLTSGELERVRECGSPTCAWLFLDRSRNGTRRWCDMSVCGNRAKARRHNQKLRSLT